MHANPRKLEKLQKRLQQILHQNNLQAQRSAIQQISDELQVDASDCAAALLSVRLVDLPQRRPPLRLSSTDTDYLEHAEPAALFVFFAAPAILSRWWPVCSSR
jgi:hypothetical protein